MNKLPTELWNAILDHLDPRGREGPTTNPRRNPWTLPQPQRPDHIDSRHHFSSLRLVCQKLNELASPYLFRSIGLRFNLNSFQRLEKLAKEPKLSKHVRKFVYLMPYLYEEGAQDFDAFRRDQSLGLSNKIRQIMFEEHEPYYYPSVLEEQRQLRRNGYDRKVLTNAFRAFAGLQEVNLLAIMVHKDIVLRNLASSFDNWEFTDCRWVPACKHAMETLCMALNEAAPPMTAFCSPTMSPQALSRISSKYNKPKTWSKLTYLEITYDERPDRSYLDTSGTLLTGHDPALTNMFTRFLHPCISLTTLNIRFTPGMPVRIPLEDAFGGPGVVFPNLCNLGIGSWMVPSDDLIAVISRHAATLRGVRLNEIYLFNGCRWVDVVTAIKETLAGRTEWVELHDISYEREYVRKQAYIETYSDTSEESVISAIESVLDDDLVERLSMRSTSSATESTDMTAVEAEQPEDVVYGNVFAAGLGSATTAPTGQGGPAGVQWAAMQAVLEAEEEEDLTDDGRTVSQAQRRHWERWILGRWKGLPYERPL